MEFSQIFAADLVKKVADSMSAQAKQKNITLGVDLGQESTLIEGDATFLRQALKNLVDNAIKFTRMGGEVQIAVHDEGDSVTFSVRDNGSGISPLDQRHIFEKFNRSASGAGEKQKGSGLGLAIVRSIAEHHGGKVWFESKLGNGSTFYLRIPKNSNMK
jgi:signal transduction histidine kinase